MVISLFIFLIGRILCSEGVTGTKSSCSLLSVVVVSQRASSSKGFDDFLKYSKHGEMVIKQVWDLWGTLLTVTG